MTDAEPSGVYADPEMEDERFEADIDLEAGVVRFCGHATPIVNMLDDEGEPTLDIEDAAAVIFRVPGQSLYAQYVFPDDDDEDDFLDYEH